MIQLIDVNQRIEFVSKEDNSEPKTIFVIKPLTGKDMLTFVADSQNGQLQLSGEKIFEFLETGIVEVKNVEGLSVKEVIDRLPASIIAELVQKIGDMNKITGQDQKN